MPINTKKVKGRRQLRYESLDDLLNDAQRLTETNIRTLGNWSQGQIYEHLARSLDSSIDGVDFSMPAPMRWMLTLFMKRRFLHKEIPPGFQAPASQALPDEIPVQQGLESLRRAVVRQQQEPQRIAHPVFGAIGRQGWNDFHLRHAEMHMSFLVNGQE